MGLSGFSTAKAPGFPLSHSAPIGRSSLCVAHTSGWGSYDGLHNLFGILLPRFVSSSLFSYSIFFFISAWIHGYIFYTLGYNPMIVDFIAQTAPALAIESSFRWLLYSLDIFLCTCKGFVLFVFVFYLFIFLTFPYFLALQDALGSSCLFLAPGIMSPKSSRSFYWSIVIRNQDVRVSFGGSYHFLRPSSC